MTVVEPDSRSARAGELETLTPDLVQKIEESFRYDLQRRRRRRRVQRLMLNVAGVILFMIVWEVAPRVVPGVNLQMFPPPSGVVGTLWDLIASGELAGHAWSSLKRAISGFVLGSTAGVLVGLLTGRLMLLRDLSDPVLHSLRSIPSIAFVPLAIVWFGLGETPKIALITWGTFFPVWVNTFIGVRDVPNIYVRSAASLGGFTRGNHAAGRSASSVTVCHCRPASSHGRCLCHPGCCRTGRGKQWPWLSYFIFSPGVQS